MKKLIKKLPVLAFVLAALAAFAFTTPAEGIMERWFEVHETTGDIGAEIIGSQNCLGTTKYCAVSFLEDDVVDGEPPITNVENDPDNYIQQLEKKN